MTAHEVGRKLLAGPDGVVYIVYPSGFEGEVPIINPVTKVTNPVDLSKDHDLNKAYIDLVCTEDEVLIVGTDI